jgi:hypothetical protein
MTKLSTQRRFEMKRLMLAATLSALFATPSMAQFPAGTPRDDAGSRPSPMGNPTPQEEVETRKDHQGRTVTEDGRLVAPQPDSDEDSTDPARHSAPGGPNDTSTDAGKLE